MNKPLNDEPLATALITLRHRQGRLLGKMEALGFDLRSEANLTVITSDVVKSSAIEGEMLNPEEVRSSIARRLGLNFVNLPRAGRDVEGRGRFHPRGSRRAAGFTLIPRLRDRERGKVGL